MSAVSTPPARFPDRYGADVLSSGPPAHHRRRPVGREVPAQRDLVVEEYAARVPLHEGRAASDHATVTARVRPTGR